MAFGFQMGSGGLTKPSTTTSSHRKLTLPFTKVTSSCLSLVVLICFQTVLMSTVSNRTKPFEVHWNTTNPIFRIDNTDHIFDVNMGKVPFEYDQVNIICPVYEPGTHEEEEMYIIYNVSKEEYDTCRITNPNPRIIAVCDQPTRLLYFTITFRSFTPQPGGLEFQPGQDYYFISTSSNEDLHRRIGGRCSTHNMKVVFKVCCATDNFYSHTISNRLPDTTANTTTSTTPITTSSTTTSTTTLPTTVKQISYKDLDLSNHNVKSTTKKTSEYDKHPNEVVKNEELTYNGVRGINSGTHCWLLLLLTLTVRLVGR